MTWLFLAFIALFIGTSKELVKKTLLNRIEPIQFVLFFYLAMFVIAQATLPKVHIPSLHSIGLILLTSSCYCLANLFGLRALQEMRISVFKPISGLSTILVLFFALIFLNETISPLQSLAVLLVIIPIIYLALTEYRKKGMTLKNIVYLGGALLFESAAVIIDRIILRSVDSFSFFYFLKLTLVIMLSLIMIFYYKAPFDKKMFVKNYRVITLLAFFTMLGSYAYFFALQDPLASTGIVKAVVSSSIVFTTLIGGLYLKEDRLLTKAGVAIVSLCGLALLLIS